MSRFPLLSDRSMWKGTDCRLLSACNVFQRLFLSHFVSMWVELASVRQFPFLSFETFVYSLSVSDVHRFFYALFLFCALIYFSVFQKEINGEQNRSQKMYFFVFVCIETDSKSLRISFRITNRIESGRDSRIESNIEASHVPSNLSLNNF